MPSIFSKIIAGEIPCYKIHEDELTFSFLSIEPIQLGHTLIVPRVEVDHFLDVSEPAYSRIFQNAKIIGQAIQKATGCKRVGTMIQGWEVPHCHYHLVPMFDPSDLSFAKAKGRSEAEMKKIQAEIQSYLRL